MTMINVSFGIGNVSLEKILPRFFIFISFLKRFEIAKTRGKTRLSIFFFTYVFLHHVRIFIFERKEIS